MNELTTIQAAKLSEGMPFWYDRYEDVSGILKDRRFGSPPPPTKILSMLRFAGFGKMVSAVETGFLSMLNAPDHARLRRIVEPFFNRRAVLALQPRIESILDGVLDSIDEGDVFDVVSQIASQLPARVIVEIFGFPAKDTDRLNTWAHQLAPLGDQELHGSALAPGLLAFWRFRRCLMQQIRERKDNPRDDLISALAAAHYGEPGISMDEVVGVSVLTFTAGQTTITHLIGSCILRLLQHPEIAQQAKEDPDCIERIVEEVLRIQSPLQRVTRMALEDVMRKGQLIPKGTTVRLLLGAANRDPNRFECPEEFNLERPRGHHMAFAAGTHFCFGLHLARLEAKVAIATVMRRYPDLIAMNAEHSWRVGTKFHGLSELPVKRSGSCPMA